MACRPQPFPFCLLIMKSSVLFRRLAPIAGLSCALMLCSGVHAEPTGPVAASAPVASRLGDLTPFRAIATEVRALVVRGDLSGARRRIRDLEIAWDRAEAGLKPRAARDWHRIDHALDQALDAVRADPPRAEPSRAALDTLLQTLDSPVAPSRPTL